MTDSEGSTGRQLHGGFLNSVVHHAGRVEKSYLGAQAATRRLVEYRALLRLRSFLDVPRVDLGGDAHTLILEFVDGDNGQHLIRQSQPELVLRLCGLALRRLQAIDIRIVNEILPGAGSVIVHGDFGPQNVLIQSAKREVSAIIDWEFCHIGAPIEDLAWAEWTVRHHHRDAIEFLPKLFAGYGSTPDRAARKLSMVNSLHRMRSFSIENGDAQDVGLWDERIDEATAWGQREFFLNGEA